jgi:hypothetical protein
MFYNTFVRENAIASKATYKGKKLYWIKGNAEHRTWDAAWTPANMW